MAGMVVLVQGCEGIIIVVATHVDGGQRGKIFGEWLSRIHICGRMCGEGEDGGMDGK